jgi:hypothetical protein
VIGLSLCASKEKSETSGTKKRTQALLRQGRISRDGGCILRGKRYCNGLPGVPGVVVLQADHLITRQNNAIFADIQVVVCLCKHCPFLEFAGRSHTQSALRPDRQNTTRSSKLTYRQIA